MKQPQTDGAQDSYERFLAERSARAQDSYERYLEQKRRQQRQNGSERVAREHTVYAPPASRTRTKRRTLLFLMLIAAVAVMILAMALLVRYISDSRAYTRYMNAAQTCTLGGDYDNSLAYLRKAAEIDLTDECLLMMAQCYEAQENYDRAIEALRAMTSDDSAISAKIAAIETKKKNKEDAGTVTVAGQTISRTAESLVLDNQNLGNSVLSELSGLYALNNLSLTGNGITDISALSQLGGLTTLNLSSNSISNLAPLAGLTSLRTLYLDDNPVTDLSPLYGLTSLTTLSIRGVSLTNEALQQLSMALPNCAINGVSTKSDVQTITLGGVTFDADVTSLDLSGRGIVDISALSACEKLTSLNLSNNSISDITPLMDIPKLQSLNLSGNSVMDLRPLMGITGLKTLDVSSNMICSTVPLESNTALTELNLSNNTISNFSGLSKLKNLTNLNLSNTGFTDDGVAYFEYLRSLIYLNVENNSGFTGVGYESLRSKIPSCNILHSDLVYNVATNVGTITTDTTDLNLTGSGISDLSFLMQMNNLQSVRLGSNNISNIYYFQYTESWRTITYLDLSSNQISDITALSNLRSLVTLNLADNMITNISALYSLGMLRELYIGGNPLTDAQILELNSYLPNCTIYFY